jgi:hypothetical protein
MADCNYAKQSDKDVTMAAIVFDVREAERKLKDAGASQELAEATADLMSRAVLSNLDALVTKDYLDARLGPMETRLGQVESRLGQVDSRLGQFELKFRDIDARIDQLRTEINGSFRLIHALLAILMAGVFIPQFQTWFSG